MRGTSQNRAPRQDNARPAGNLSNAPMSAGPARKRQGRVRGHAAGRHGSAVGGFLVIGPAPRTEEGQRLAPVRRLKGPQRSDRPRPLYRPTHPRQRPPDFGFYHISKKRTGDVIPPNNRPPGRHRKNCHHHTFRPVTLNVVLTISFYILPK
jgi:hypothetical protein